MNIDHVLAVVPVTDLDTSNRWYESFFGRPRRQQPWVQVFTDDERSGSGLLNFAVDDLQAAITELQRRGLNPGEITEANKGVRLSAISDPDGNTIRLVGGFRVKY